MRIILLYCLLAAILGCQSQPCWEELGSTIRKFDDSVLAVVITDAADNNEEKCYIGSAFVVGKGYLLTNSHVIEEGTGNILVFWDDTIPQHPPLQARVVYNDRVTDLALLYVDEPQIDWQALPLGDVSDLQLGDPVLILGFPDISQPEWEDSKSLTALKGFIAALHRNQHQQISRLILDARVLGGSSGGPVINLRTSKVIGVATEVLIDSEAEEQELPYGGSQTHSIEWGTLGAAIPINQIRHFLRKASQSRQPPQHVFGAK